MKLNFQLFAASCAVAASTSSVAAATETSKVKVTDADLKELYKGLSTFAVPGRVSPDAWLQECAYHIMLPDYPDAGEASEPHVNNNWTQADYFYKDAEHGACTMKLESAFGMSWNYTLKQVFDDYFEGISPFDSKELAALSFEGIADSLPGMTLPSLMVEPQTAKDAVEVVKFAKHHALQVSVKNTGHDYAGQSDVKDSFQLNMRNFPKYSAMDKYVVTCDKDQEYTPLEGPPCKLANARGKPAIVRVSGSEGNDSIYSSVWNWNHKQPRKKRVQVSGGGEGAIGAGGGYLMGGGMGNGANDRKWGVMVDQVLELEMVLANGQHVKFGPSEWVVVEGYLYPQTKKVKGLCNKNVHHLEDKWEWGECEIDIPFEDLWFAVRGGGGGTWGVLLSSWVQLHDYEEWYSSNFDTDAKKTLLKQCKKDGNCSELKKMTNEMWTDFYINFFAGQTSEEFGNDNNASCGSNDPVTTDLPLGDVDGTAPHEVFCIGKSAAEKMVKSWQKYVPTSQFAPDNVDEDLLKGLYTMTGMGGTYGDIIVKAPLIGVIPPGFNENMEFALSDAQDSPEQPNALMKAPAGLALSVKTAAPFSAYGYNIFIPTKMVAENSAYVRDLMNTCLAHTLGGNVPIAGDGMDSLNKLYRKSYWGCQINMESPGLENITTYEEFDDYLSELQSKVMEYIDEKDVKNNIFPGWQEKNHVQGNTPLPLKDDWTKVCPYNLSTEERKEKCMSVQESIWGTENMERMEKIKKSIDPDNMFQVYIGIGQRDVSPQQEYKWPTQLPKDYNPLAPVSISYNNGDGNGRHLRGRN